MAGEVRKARVTTRPRLPPRRELAQELLCASRIDIHRARTGRGRFVVAAEGPDGGTPDTSAHRRRELTSPACGDGSIDVIGTSYDGDVAANACTSAVKRYADTSCPLHATPLTLWPRTQAALNCHGALPCTAGHVPGELRGDTSRKILPINNDFHGRSAGESRKVHIPARPRLPLPCRLEHDLLCTFRTDRVVL